MSNHSQATVAASPSSLPQQRWHICPPQPQVIEQLKAIAIQPLLRQVLANRGLTTQNQAEQFLQPELQPLPSPLTEFPDLSISLELLETAIQQQRPILICGDYDADGMTSTALLLRALRGLGGKVDYAIPSRMNEGYGINTRMVEEFAAAQGHLILTVDNGIAAREPIARARELGLVVIITDHHDLPPDLPPAQAILNPKLIAETSPYRCLAGVGVAYILAVSLARQMSQGPEFCQPFLDLFTLGTIADLAPLTGVNRRWLQRGLAALPQSALAGVQALIQVSGSQGKTAQQPFKPETIGFRLGPRINAIGRIGDPQVVIELLTTDDPTLALERATVCEQVNQQRKQLCQQIETAAIACIENNTDGTLNPIQQRVLVLVEPDWHHGVIGIVASRLVERYGVPVFIGTYEDEATTQIRGSARSIPEFDIFLALQTCHDLLNKYGGHTAAGGFTLAATNLSDFQAQLSAVAHQQLQPEQLQPLVTIDAEATFDALTLDLYTEIDQLQPCGIGNAEPVFWSQRVQVLEQRVVGQNQGHLKLTLAQDSPFTASRQTLGAIAWRWGEYYPLPQWVDLAYRLRLNEWQGDRRLELELMGIRPAAPLSDSKLGGWTESAIPPENLIEGLPLPTQAATESNTASSPAKQRRPASPLLPKVDLQLQCPEPPAQLPPHLTWLPLSADHLDDILTSIQGGVLLYGYQRPYRSAQQTSGHLEYDRPHRPCPTVILWTLPPSWTHLRWLITVAQAATIYVRNALPKVLDAQTLRSQLAYEIVKKPEAPLNLLNLGQQWWVSPSALIAALRELNYPCSEFPETASLEQELQRLERWYHCSTQRLANLR